jgi:hypothetical protein
MRIDRIALLLILVTCAVAGRWWSSRPPRERPALPPPQREIHLLPLGSSLDMPSVQAAVVDFTGHPASIDEPAELDPTAFNAKRRQYDADVLGKSIPVPAGHYVLALTAADLYTSQIPDWRYCFGSRFASGGLVSQARMGPFPGEPSELAQSRRNKMVIRYILEGAYGLKRSQDPQSLLYSKILGPSDLDRMEFRI